MLEMKVSIFKKPFECPQDTFFLNAVTFDAVLENFQDGEPLRIDLLYLAKEADSAWRLGSSITLIDSETERSLKVRVIEISSDPYCRVLSLWGRIMASDKGKRVYE